MTLKLTHIQKRHDRKKFDCGNDDLNKFLANSARPSSDKRMTRTYVLEHPDNPDRVMGYVTLTYTTVDIPSGCKPGKNLKNPVPALLLAKMAISNEYKGKGYGKDLFTFAIKKASETSHQVGGIGLVIDAKDQAAKQFYIGQAGPDIEIIDNTGLKLWLPISICDTITQTLSQP